MTTRPIALIEISGTPRQAGRMYGEAARDRIEVALDHYRTAFTVFPGLSWPEVLDRARAWWPIVAAAAPELADEMHGIAEGAGVTADDILALNARGEIARSADSAFLEMAAAETEGCSAFAVLGEAAGDGHVYCGQNWDWQAGTAASAVLVRVIRPPRPTVIMQVEAGQVGRHGANSAGIALNANGLDGRFGAPPGVPQPILRRLILEAATLRDAIQVPFAYRQHIATNLVITHRDGFAIDLETTPVAHAWGYPRAGILAHGNHYLYGTPPTLPSTYRPSSVDSLVRTPVLQHGLEAVRGAGDPAGVRKLIAETMSDHLGFPHSICSHIDPTEDPAIRQKTIMASIVDLTAGQYRVAAGNPCENDYELLPWHIGDGPGGAQ